MNSIRFLTCWLLLGVLVAACSKSPDSKKTATEASVLDREFAARRDTLAGRWRAMLAADDEHLFYTKRLLQELELVPGVDKAKLRELQQANERLKTRRYATPDALIPDSVDAYDEAQRRVLDPAMALASPYVADTVRYPLVGELTTDLQAYYNTVVVVRGHYNEAAQAYNDWLTAHRQEVPAASAAKPTKLF